MKKAIMCVITGMMILSLAACTPTTEKNKTGETKAQPKVEVSEDTTKKPDPNAPQLEVVSIYSVSADGSKLEGTMDAVEEVSAENLTALLIQYDVLDEGTEVISFTAEGEAASADFGPGATDVAKKETGVIDFNQFPDTENEKLLQAVANTYLENLNVLYLTIQVNGETVAENLAFQDAGK